MVTNMSESRATDTGLIDAKAAGALLGVPPSWVLAEARGNRVPRVRLGRYVRFRRETLLHWVNEREQGPVPRPLQSHRGAAR
jgi:predicted DNA-binding transcriptional regulator AlpA